MKTWLTGDYGIWSLAALDSDGDGGGGGSSGSSGSSATGSGRGGTSTTGTSSASSPDMGAGFSAADTTASLGSDPFGGGPSSNSGGAGGSSGSSSGSSGTSASGPSASGMSGASASSAASAPSGTTSSGAGATSSPSTSAGFDASDTTSSLSNDAFSDVSVTGSRGLGVGMSRGTGAVDAATGRQAGVDASPDLSSPDVTVGFDAADTTRGLDPNAAFGNVSVTAGTPSAPSAASISGATTAGRASSVGRGLDTTGAFSNPSIATGTPGIANTGSFGAPAPAPSFRAAEDQSMAALDDARLDAITQAIIGIESNFNPNAKNPKSSALGLGQFTESTWLDMVDRYAPNLAENRTRAQVLALREDPEIATQMTRAYVQHNQAILAENNAPVNPATSYLAHFMGPVTAARVATAPANAPVSSYLSPAAINANRSVLQGKTVGEVVGWAEGKMAEANDASIAGPYAGHPAPPGRPNTTATVGVDDSTGFYGALANTAAIGRGFSTNAETEGLAGYFSDLSPQAQAMAEQSRSAPVSNVSVAPSARSGAYTTDAAGLSNPAESYGVLDASRAPGSTATQASVASAAPAAVSRDPFGGATVSSSTFTDPESGVTVSANTYGEASRGTFLGMGSYGSEDDADPLGALAGAVTDAVQGAATIAGISSDRTEAAPASTATAAPEAARATAPAPTSTAAIAPSPSTATVAPSVSSSSVTTEAPAPAPTEATQEDAVALPEVVVQAPEQPAPEEATQPRQQAQAPAEEARPARRSFEQTYLEATPEKAKEEAARAKPGFGETVLSTAIDIGLGMVPGVGLGLGLANAGLALSGNPTIGGMLVGALGETGLRGPAVEGADDFGNDGAPRRELAGMPVTEPESSMRPATTTTVADFGSTYLGWADTVDRPTPTERWGGRQDYSYA